MLDMLLAAALCAHAALADLTGIPTVPFTTSGDASYDAEQTVSVIVDRRYANTTDTNGWTEIPPTLSDFALTFAEDLGSFVDQPGNVELGEAPSRASIFLTLDNSTDYQDAAGRWTSEAYTLQVEHDHVTISGASPLGVWWGTRSLIQQMVLNNGSVSTGSGVDSPGWNTRGIFVSL